MKQTPLYSRHVAQKARLVDFAGWDMPIQYSGVVDEYQAVRQAAGLFDVSHMGRIRIQGEGTASFLQRVTTNNVQILSPGNAQYSMICNDEGGILDDIFIYRLEVDVFLLCVNASNREKILAWLFDRQEETAGVKILDQSQEVAQVALQGPAAGSILSPLTTADLPSLKLRHCRELSLAGVTCLIARTGYTGEFGYELYIPSKSVSTIWDALLAKGTPAGLKPAGLGSRDLLRLEMGYLLYGNDISEDTTPLEAGVGWAVDLKKEDFIGARVLKQQQAAGCTRKLVAFQLRERGVPRHGFAVYAQTAPQDQVGQVTSGNFSPLLQRGIGLAYVPPEYDQPGGKFFIDIRGKRVPAEVVKLPFYRKKNA